jgi:hypothetical protein
MLPAWRLTVSSGGKWVVRRKTVAREEPMHVGVWRVGKHSGIRHGDLAPGQGQHQRRTVRQRHRGSRQRRILSDARLLTLPGIDNAHCCFREGDRTIRPWTN